MLLHLGLVRLAEEKDSDDDDGGGRDGRDPEDPAPPDTLGDEGAEDRAQGGTEEGGGHVDGEGAAALFGGLEIAHEAAGEGVGHAGAEPGEQAEGEDLPQRGGGAAGRVPDGEDDARGDEDGLAAVDLGQRGQEQRGEADADEDEGVHEEPVVGLRYAQAARDLPLCRRDHGLGEGLEEGEAGQDQGCCPFLHSRPVYGTPGVIVGCPDGLS